MIRASEKLKDCSRTRHQYKNNWKPHPWHFKRWTIVCSIAEVEIGLYRLVQDHDSFRKVAVSEPHDVGLEAPVPPPRW